MKLGKMRVSQKKKESIENFSNYVSSGKVKFFKKYGLDFVMGRREGPYLWDMDGNKRLFNLHCNGGVFNLGHRNREIINVLREGLEEFDIGNHHLMSRCRADLAELLARFMPSDIEYTVFGTGGGDAVDLAFKVARAHTGRAEIISAKGGYHGHTGLAMAAGDEKYRKPFGPQAPGFRQVPFGDFKALSEAAGKDTAAIILETIPATLGVVIPTNDYMRSVRDLCDRYEIILILDEVQTGLGRTGKLWAFEHFNIEPDIVVLGKGLSGGLYPISATVMKRPLESVFHADPFIHVSTFGGAEIGCIVAKRVLEISSEPRFLDHVNLLSERFSRGITAIMEKEGRFIVGFRRLGLMMGLELKDELCGPVLTKTAYDNDLLMVFANNDPSVCQFLPPLVMEQNDVEWVLSRLEKAVHSARRLKPVASVKRQIENLFR